MNTSNSETEVISYSSIVKSNTSKTTDNTINTVDESVDKPADESVVPADESVVPADESVVPADESVVPADKSVVPADKPADESVDKPADESVVPADKSVVPADKPADESVDKPADESVVPADRTTERKPRYAKSSINIKVNFRKTNNTPTNPSTNNIDYINALKQASNTFFSECIISDNVLIEKEKAKINRFGNKYTPTIVHKVSYDKDFEPQKIGNQTIVFSREHFIKNQIFIKRLIREYENIFQECDWINIKNSERANELKTLLIIIGKNKN
jgi:hypothetical protein